MFVFPNTMAPAFVNGRWCARVPFIPDLGHAMESARHMWNAVRNESRELFWLASMVSCLSLVGVGLAVGLALVLVGVP